MYEASKSRPAHKRRQTTGVDQKINAVWLWGCLKLDIDLDRELLAESWEVSKFVETLCWMAIQGAETGHALTVCHAFMSRTANRLRCRPLKLTCKLPTKVSPPNRQANHGTSARA